MKELSLNILDITQNSITSRAKNILISLVESDDGWLTLTITDDGCGMSDETLRTVMDPFYTTRTTRKVGMGIPLLKLACEQTGGTLNIVSKDEKSYPDEHGTTLCATFDTKHIDMTPVGDMVSTVEVLLQGHPEGDGRGGLYRWLWPFAHLCAGYCAVGHLGVYYRYALLLRVALE